MKFFIRCTLAVVCLFLCSNSIAQSKILIAYHSPTGNTKSLAEAIEKGAQTVSGMNVQIKAIGEVTDEDLLQADAIILGSPVYNGNVTPEVQAFINSWPFENRPLKNKIGAAFASGGGISIGEEAVLMSIIRSMLIHGMLIVGGDSIEASFGASSVTEEAPFANGQFEGIFMEKAEGLGRRVAELLQERN